MSYLAGMEKFGLGGMNLDNLYEEEEKTRLPEHQKEVKEKEQEREEDYLFDKKVICPVCDKEFVTKTVKSSKVRIIGSDRDLRPRYKTIDNIKYGITSCPFCGYSAMSGNFEHLSALQIKLIQDEVCSKFNMDMADIPDYYTYDMALDRYKLSLFSTVAKKGRNSEKAYTCLKMSWLCRGKAEEMLTQGVSQRDSDYLAVKKEELYYYKQAYSGLIKAVSSEHFPICGMDQNTMDLLLAQMGFILKDYETCSKLISRILVSGTASSRIKDKARELKEDVINTLKNNK